MTYISRGKRSIMEAEYTVDVRTWAKHFKIAPPIVKVRKRRAGVYRMGTGTIAAPPNASKDALAHEFAHHIDHVIHHGKGHGPSFRIALVEVATVVYGHAGNYTWDREYENIQKWARHHGLKVDA